MNSFSKELICDLNQLLCINVMLVCHVTQLSVNTLNDLYFRGKPIDALEKRYIQSMNTKVSPESKNPSVLRECIEFLSASWFNYLA